MKLPIDIEALLRGESVEWERLEFKAGWNPASVIHTICAFANDFHNLGGGYVFIGIAEDDGRPVLPPVGLEPNRLDSIQQELLNLGNTAIQPHYHPVAVPYEIDGKHVLVLWVSGGQNRPYRAKKSLGNGSTEYQWYIRKHSSTVQARGEDVQELMGLAAKVPFDDRVNQQASVDDLSKPLIVEFLAEVGSELADEANELSTLELARQMQLVDGPDEAPLPRNVGLMFFNEDPRSFFPGTQIDVVWFPDGPGGDTFKENTFTGPLHVMIADALDYIERLYLDETVIKHPDRAQSTRVDNFPYAAVEEALVNAVYHRSYEQREPVEVRIEPEHLTVLSYPGPDRSVDLDRLRDGRAMARRYRNRRIGEFLKELDLTEGRGTGVPKIQRAMRENGSPDPVFEFDDEHTYFQVTLPVHPDAHTTTHQSADHEATSLDWENAKERVLDALIDEARRGEGLANEDVRRIAALDRHEAKRLLLELRDEHRIFVEGRGRGARWFHPQVNGGD